MEVFANSSVYYSQSSVITFAYLSRGLVVFDCYDYF